MLVHGRDDKKKTKENVLWAEFHRHLNQITSFCGLEKFPKFATRQSFFEVIKAHGMEWCFRLLEFTMKDRILQMPDPKGTGIGGDCIQTIAVYSAALNIGTFILVLVLCFIFMM